MFLSPSVNVPLARIVYVPSLWEIITKKITTKGTFGGLVITKKHFVSTLTINTYYYQNHYHVYLPEGPQRFHGAVVGGV
jgi:hypothetical protein